MFFSFSPYGDLVLYVYQCRAASRILKRLQQLRDALAVLEGEYAEWFGPQPCKRPYWVIAYIAAVGGLDIFFFGPAAQFLAAGMSHYVGVGAVAPFIVPWLILGLDIGLGTRRASQGRDRVKWNLVCLSLIASIVCFTTASQVAILVTYELPGAVASFLLFGLILLVAVAHGALVFMGEPVEKAIEYVVVAGRRRRLEERIEDLEDRFEEAEREALKLLGKHLASDLDETPEAFEAWAQTALDDAYQRSRISPLGRIQ